MKNAEIAAIFETMADIMEIRGENTFRVNSYRKVARVVGDMAEDIAKVAAEGGLTSVAGIGKSSAEKIEEYLATGRMRAYERLLEGFPTGALEMLRIPEVGPKTVARLMKEKGITSVAELESAIEKGELVGMPGMGAKSIENIRKGIALVKARGGRTPLGSAWPVAQGIVDALRAKIDLKAAEPAGSLRRMRETIGDIDILATVKRPRHKAAGKAGEIPGGREVVEAFTSLEDIAEVLAAGATKGSVRTRSGLQVDLRVVPPESFGAALQYFTGSKAHNIKIRGIAAERGLKVNEYGVFRGRRRVAGETEQEVYEALDLPWIPPELREDRGEVEAAAAGELPALVTMDQVRGDLHVHTRFSDSPITARTWAWRAGSRKMTSCGATTRSTACAMSSAATRSSRAPRWTS